MRLLYPFLAFILLSCQGPGPRYVVTQGRSEVKVPIETMTLSITIRSKNKSLSEANQETRHSVLSMFHTLKKFGIPDTAFVTTDNTSSDTHDSYRDDQMAEVQYSGTFDLADTRLFDPVFNELAALGNVSIRISDFNSSKVDEYTKQSYEASLKSARKQADLLLAGTGVKAGRILKVLKGQADAFDEYDNFEKHIENSLAPKPIPDYDIAMPNLEQTFRRKYYEISSSVTVMFEIE
jgi:uncharacterized protein YggE